MGARFVDCPRCGAKVAWLPESLYRPFCSERCKLVDMGDWSMERYRMPIEDDKDAPDTDKQE